MKTLSNWQRLLGIDLGSSSVRIWSSDKPDLIINQPSCIAVDTRNEKVLAIGTEAQAMEGRVSQHISIVYPVQDGVIYDLDAAKALLKVLLQQSYQKTFNLASPSVMVSVPADATEVEKQTFVEAVQDLGVREVLTIAQPLAASIGAGVPIADASGCFIMQMGGGIVESAIISLGSLVKHESNTHAGNTLIGNIRYTLKQEASLDISKETAQYILKNTVSLREKTQKQQLIAGQNVESGSPMELEVKAEFFGPMLQEMTQQYERLLQRLLNRIPPELTVDVIDKGLLLSGGLAQLDGLDDYLVAKLGIPVSVVDNSHETTIRGIITALEHLNLFKESLGYVG